MQRERNEKNDSPRRSARRSSFKKALTEPTLLEMPGKACVVYLKERRSIRIEALIFIQQGFYSDGVHPNIRRQATSQSSFLASWRGAAPKLPNPVLLKGALPE